MKTSAAMRALGRCVRSSPTFPLADISAVVGDAATALRHLANSDGRGRCGTVTVPRYLSMSVATQTRVLGSLWCSPSLKRLAAANTGRVAASRAGTAGWAGRSVVHDIAPRSVIAAAVAADSDTPRRRAAANPACPPAMLRRLSVDPSWELRVSVLQNRKCPTDVLETLFANADESVVVSVATHPACPSSLLRRFSEPQQVGACLGRAETPTAATRCCRASPATSTRRCGPPPRARRDQRRRSKRCSLRTRNGKCAPLWQPTTIAVLALCCASSATTTGRCAPRRRSTHSATRRWWPVWRLMMTPVCEPPRRLIHAAAPNRSAISSATATTPYASRRSIIGHARRRRSQQPDTTTTTRRWQRYATRHAPEQVLRYMACDPDDDIAAAAAMSLARLR